MVLDEEARVELAFTRERLLALTTSCDRQALKDAGDMLRYTRVSVDCIRIGICTDLDNAKVWKPRREMWVYRSVHHRSMHHFPRTPSSFGPGNVVLPSNRFIAGHRRVDFAHPSSSRTSQGAISDHQRNVDKRRDSRELLSAIHRAHTLPSIFATVNTVSRGICDLQRNGAICAPRGEHRY